MSRTGNPYDNAKAERFIRTLKYEEIYMNDYETPRRGARLDRAFHRSSLQSQATSLSH
jgi:transposase InsO family protein